jgi:hypothetical protein
MEADKALAAERLTDELEQLLTKDPYNYDLLRMLYRCYCNK